MAERRPLVFVSGRSRELAVGDTVSFALLSGRPTTLAGYGITDAAPIAHVGSGGAAHANASASAAGFMAAADKSKLDGIASGVSITAGEAIGAGKFVYIASDGKAYLAGYSSADTAASLYVLDAIASGTSGYAYQDGTNTALSGLTPGAIYALGTSGGIALASTLTATSGTLLQIIGTAISTTNLAVSIQPAILRS